LYETCEAIHNGRTRKAADLLNEVLTKSKYR